MKKLLSCTLFVMAYCLPCSAQIFPAKNYPGGYFRDPLNIPISLAGNFGELRPNHYHMGLDIRTNHHVNLPVFAAAAGYIAHVKVEPEGFGQAVYINHPNGYTTVYGHLNDFFPALSAYVKQQQYQQQRWRLFLDIPPGLFPVKKGDWIALSGSTGGSQAPHVHFEIRSTADDVNKNPMLFRMPISDITSPVILRLAIYSRSESIYEQTPRMVQVKRSAHRFYLPGGTITVNDPKIGLGISAFDTESGSSNRNGIYEADLFDNNQPVTGFQMDNISYDDTRNVNAHIDYKTKSLGGPYIQLLFQLYGYVHSIYHPVSGDGTLDLSDGRLHPIKILVKDPMGNSSTLDCNIRYRPAAVRQSRSQGKMFYPMMLDGYETQDCAFYIGEKCLYDSVHVQYSTTLGGLLPPDAISQAHQIGETYIPLGDTILVRIKSLRTADPAIKKRVVMKRTGAGKQEVRKVEWQGDWASAHFRDFGNFQLFIDTTAPLIIPVGFSQDSHLETAKRIMIRVKDNMGSYKDFRATLDGKWLRFSNDKGTSFIYTFDEHCPRGRHELSLEVEDEAGNSSRKTIDFTR